MCGIIGIFGKNQPTERAHQALKKIVHRGSDVYELASFPTAVLGANRLPIVDRAFGKQPQSNEDQTLFVAQNGEIFNYKILQTELKEKGHRFQTDSDTEVLVHLFEEYGPSMVNRLDSEMFAFIIYNKKDGSVFAARDPLGVKPLYYATDTSGQLYFASELKQLTVFDDIEQVHTFPPGSYFFQGQFVKYFHITQTNNLKDETKAIDELETRMVEAVRKRVQTDLPIGVFLSGGVDSSLIMEIATRLHPDVTAIILGFPGSSDYEFAVRFCKERKYKYHVVHPDVDYEKQLEDLIYHLETYEPLIIRQSFSLDICAREAQRLGLRVVLVGEGSDELFGGYNEFARLPDHLINKGCQMLTESLHTGHLQRVDRMSMRHTIEIRSPFFDRDVVALAFQTSGHLKVHREQHQITTKYLVRKVAEKFLPEYIAWRYKVPFSNGAGMNVGNNFNVEDGDIAKIVKEKSFAPLSKETLHKYHVTTQEGAYYLSEYVRHRFDKLVNSEMRIVVKDNLDSLSTPKNTRLLVAEFDRLAIYFPIYFASEKKFFDLHGLDVDFISTGGDDRTYASLVNNSAQIGLADPMFAMFENTEGVKGEIIGELVQKIPNVAITIRPDVQISRLEDFKPYVIGTFQEFSTTHSVAKHFLPKETTIVPCDYRELMQRLVDRSIDVAIVLPEQAAELIAQGGRIIFDFQQISNSFLFSGFTVANTLDKRYRNAVRSFLSAAREAVRSLLKNKDEAFKSFVNTFPSQKDAHHVFEIYCGLWSKTLQVESADYQHAFEVWKKNYPTLLREYRTNFLNPSPAASVLNAINVREHRRDFPFLEDVLEKQILRCQQEHLPLNVFGFWGASNKRSMDSSDVETIKQLGSYFSKIQQTLQEPVNVTIILSDAHAIMNGYEKKVVNAYLSDIRSALKKQGFSVVLLSQLWKKWKLTERTIKNNLKKQPTGWWDDVTVAADLEQQAQKRFVGKNKRLGAQQYYLMRLTEKLFLEKEFKNHLFFAFADGRQQTIFPKLPTIYLYTTGRSHSEAPWFTQISMS